ncbi:hypothetical protein AX15_001730 [Amanita polypyramis BW_CC]|nr:hypothetical protein AX15_001730 [Amanita polypyramis BW_CC]
MADVPQELVDLVIDSIHDDYRSLLTASLVCRTWYLSTRPHLFRRAVFHIDFFIPSFSDSDDDVREPLSFHRFYLLRDIIEENPSITYHIRELVISGATSHKFSSWKRVESLVAAILSQLDRVSSIVLRDVNWEHLSVPCRHALRSIFDSPHLEHIELYSFNAPLHITLSLIGSANNLKSFSFSFTPATNFHSPFGLEMNKLYSITVSRVQLQELEIGSNPRLPEFAGLLLNPNCPISISELQRLRMTHVTDVPMCGQLLRASGNSLKELELWAPTSREPKRVGDNISINWLPALRSFQIRGLLFSPSVCSVFCLCDIFTPEKSHNLQEIEFLIDIDNTHRSSLNWNPWSQLDDILSGSKFPSLRKVDVTLSFSRPDASAHTNLAAFQNSMPRLVEQGKLAVCCG